jgi:hypothetical protein
MSKYDDDTSFVKKLDFTKITRNTDRFRTSISVNHLYGRSAEWITCGSISLISLDYSNNLNLWSVRCCLDKATDFEHDAASILSFDVVGLDFEFMNNGMSCFNGWIQSDDSESFRIPPPDYDPLKGSVKCKECKGDYSHVIVQEGFYIPRANQELWEKFRGMKVRIITGPFADKPAE